VAHDFNNLMTNILGNTSLLDLALEGDPEARHRLEQVEATAQRAAELARQLLAYAGREALQRQPLDATAIIEEMAHLLEVSVKDRGTLRLRCEKDLPFVLGDPTQLRQVALNLILNAAEALADAGGVIAVGTGAVECDRQYLARACPDDRLAEGIYVYIEVIDTGRGMDAETQRRIFDPFFSTKRDGRGLGLSAVLGIVRAHRGAIMVQSSPGHGATFRVLLPCAAEQAATVSPAREDVHAWGTGTILVVDDEETVRALTRRMLELLGFQALTAANGAQALQLLDRCPNRPRAILLDMTMPQMDGRAAYDALTKIHPGIPVVLTTGYDPEQAKQRFEGCPLAGFLQKPYKLEHLNALLQEVLQA
jgi:CheY-like chemotaxis protein